MAFPEISYDSVVIKQVVENWGDEKGLNAPSQISLHLEERFKIRTFKICSASDEGSFLMLKISTDLWPDPREFGLLANGSLAW